MHVIYVLMSLSLNPVVRESSLEEDTKPLIESGFCDSIVSFEDVLGLDLEEEEEEDIPPLVETDITFGPLVQYTYAVPNIIDYIEQIESNNVSGNVSTDRGRSVAECSLRDWEVVSLSPARAMAA